jgi:hypothetical protein
MQAVVEHNHPDFGHSIAERDIARDYDSIRLRSLELILGEVDVHLNRRHRHLEIDITDPPQIQVARGGRL